MAYAEGDFPTPITHHPHTHRGHYCTLTCTHRWVERILHSPCLRWCS